jgi:transcriptional regulator with XRE-family HTH domain
MADRPYKDWGEGLKALREAVPGSFRGHATQQEAADAIGVTRPTYAKWEMGEHNPNRENRAALASWIGTMLPGVSADDFDTRTRVLAVRDRIRRRGEDANTIMDDQASAGDTGAGRTYLMRQRGGTPTVDEVEIHEAMKMEMDGQTWFMVRLVERS